MGATVLTSSQLSHGAAAAPHACASRFPINPACISRSAVSASAAAAAAAKKSERSGSFCADEPPRKRRRAGEDGGAAAACREEAMSLEEKEDVNNLLLSLPPLGSSPNKVLPLPDSILRVLQENRTRGGLEEDEIEIDVYCLGDDALRSIKHSVAAYLEDRKSKQREHAGGHAPERRVSRGPLAASPSLPVEPSASDRAVAYLDRARRKDILSQSSKEGAVPKDMQHMPLQSNEGVKLKEIQSQSSEKGNVLKVIQSRSNKKGDIRKSTSRSIPVPLKKSGSSKPMSELLADAHAAMVRSRRRQELERLRAVARREVEQIVRTVEFNDPYIDPQDVFKESGS